VCGIAMQATKTRENQSYFDRYECLVCHTVITETRPAEQDDDAQD
jgi:cytochrome c551/c552